MSFSDPHLKKSCITSRNHYHPELTFCPSQTPLKKKLHYFQKPLSSWILNGITFVFVFYYFQEPFSSWMNLLSSIKLHLKNYFHFQVPLSSWVPLVPLFCWFFIIPGTFNILNGPFVLHGDPFYFINFVSYVLGTNVILNPPWNLIFCLLFISFTYHLSFWMNLNLH